MLIKIDQNGNTRTDSVISKPKYENSFLNSVKFDAFFLHLLTFIEFAGRSHIESFCGLALFKLSLRKDLPIIPVWCQLDTAITSIPLFEISFFCAIILLCTG